MTRKAVPSLKIMNHAQPNYAQISSIIVNDDKDNALVVYISAIAKVDLHYLDALRPNPHEPGVRIVLKVPDFQGYPDAICCFGAQAVQLRRYFLYTSGRSFDLRVHEEDEIEAEEYCREKQTESSDLNDEDCPSCSGQYDEDNPF